MNESGTTNSNSSLNLTEAYYVSLLSKALQNAEEERMLALDRFRRADDQMEDAEQFAVLGKNAVQFLDLGAKRTNTMLDISKEIKSIIFKNEEQNINVSFDDSKKTAIQESIKDLESDGEFSMDIDDDEEDALNLPDSDK
jgi:hypothetical protein